VGAWIIWGTIPYFDILLVIPLGFILGFLISSIVFIIVIAKMNILAKVFLILSIVLGLIGGLGGTYNYIMYLRNINYFDPYFDSYEFNPDRWHIIPIAAGVGFIAPLLCYVVTKIRDVFP
jgi:hypothetical protein